MLVKRTTRPTVTMVRMRTVHLLRKVYLKPEVLVVISMLLAVANDQNAAIVHHCLSAWEGRGPARAYDGLAPQRREIGLEMGVRSRKLTASPLDVYQGGTKDTTSLGDI
jgi:hypothetical protein